MATADRALGSSSRSPRRSAKELLCGSQWHPTRAKSNAQHPLLSCIKSDTLPLRRCLPRREAAPRDVERSGLPRSVRRSAESALGRFQGSLRVMLAPETLLGPGKGDLLQGIRETGSIAAAARRMGMSYKRAQYLIDTPCTAPSARPRVEANIGGKAGGGARHTPIGEAVLEGYRRMEMAARDAVAGESGHLASTKPRSIKPEQVQSALTVHLWRALHPGCGGPMFNPPPRPGISYRSSCDGPGATE